MAKKKIMGWFKCTIRTGKTPNDEGMATNLVKVAIPKEKTAVLESEDGESMEAYGTGHELVGAITAEGNFSLTYRVIEPDDDFYAAYGLGEEDVESEEFLMQTHVVEDEYSVEVEPYRAGATGIRAPKTSVSLKPGWSEEEGHYCDVTHKFLKGDAGYWYSRYKKVVVATPKIKATGNSITITCATEGATIKYKKGDSDSWHDYSSAITVASADNNKVLSAKAVKGSKESAIATHTIAYTSGG